MPSISFPKEELKRYLKKPIKDEELKEAMSMIGTDISSFEEEIKVEIFPDRPDQLSVQGLSRALNHFLGYTKGMDEYHVKKGDGVVKVLPSAKGVRPYTACAIIRNLKYDDEKIKDVIEIQEKLHITFGRNRRKIAIGIYPLEKITLPIAFGAENPKKIIFRPLESDEEMNAEEMLEEHPTGREYAHLLKGYKKYPVFRDAKKKVLSVPPIINSHDVGKITEDTRDVFIECSGHDLKPLREALRMIVCAMADMGGTIESMTVDYGDKKITMPDLKPYKLRIDQHYVCERAGIPRKDLKKSLQLMGLQLEGDEVIIPAYRTDFIHQVDVVEEAAIGYGYNNIKSEVPALHTIGKLDNRNLFLEKIREVLSGLGLLEVMNYYITDEGIKLENPLTQEYSALRRDITHQLLRVLEKNTSVTYPQEIFDIGPVFHHDKEADTGVGEAWHLGAMMCGEEAGYTRARRALEALGKALGWKLTFSEHDDPRYIEGRCAKVSGSAHGIIGEINPEELEKHGIQMPAASFEITLP